MNIVRHFFVAVMMFIAVASAQAAGRGIDRATGQAIWDAATSGKTTTLGIGNGAMRIVGPKGATTATAGGGAKVTGTGVAEVGGVRVPVGMSGEVAKDVIAGTVAGCLTGGIAGCVLGTLTPLAIAYAASSGTRIDPVSGAPQVQDKLTCTIAPCYEYTGTYVTPTYLKPSAICKAIMAAYNGLGEQYVWSNPRFDGSGTTASEVCRFDVKWRDTGKDNGNNGVPLSSRSTEAASSPTWNPATPQDVKDALYNNDPPPEIVDELSKYGNIIWPLGNVKVTGPTEVTGPKETSVSKSGNDTKTTVSQDKTPMSYDGPSVTAGNTTKTSTTTTTTTNPDGSTTTTGSETTTTTTESGSSPTKEPEPEPAPTDTPLPDLPKLYTRKYPDGMEGIYNEYKSRMTNSQFVDLASKLMPAVPSGGQCPSWPMNMNLSSWAAYGTHDVAPPCWIWDVAAAVLVVSALLLARALVFGG